MSTSGSGCAPAADRPRLARRCGPARCECGAGCGRGTSAAPPHFAEALGRRRRQVALAQPRPDGRQSSVGAGTLRNPLSVVRGRDRRGDAAGHFVQPRMRHQPGEGAERQLLQAVLSVPRLGLLDVASAGPAGSWECRSSPGRLRAHAPHRLDANGSAGSCDTPMNCGVRMAPMGPEYTHGKLWPPILRYTGQVFRQAPQRMQ